MRDLSDQLIAVGSALVVILVMAYILYRPKVQRSETYQATVVPLANIMDVGFILLSPAIVILIGKMAPLAMLAICGVAIAAGAVMAYNIRHFEPLLDTDDPAVRVESTAQWALLGASIVNIAYYTLILITLLLLPLDAYTEGRRTVIGVIYLAAIAAVGYLGGMTWLNKQGDRTTAFNLAAVFGVLVAFLVYNLQEWLGGRWELGPSPEVDADALRKVIGLFAMVQGFEASRYIGVRFGRETRIKTMRVAQLVSTVVFTLLVFSILALFLPPATVPDGLAIFYASEQIGEGLAWLLLLAAIGSQTAAIIGATSSRSDMLVAAKVPRKLSFLAILVPAIGVVILADVSVAVNLASRVFAFYFLIQCALAGYLARRRGQSGALVGFALVGLAMATILVFGLPL